jgi:hypothetical protein
MWETSKETSKCTGPYQEKRGEKEKGIFEE